MWEDAAQTWLRPGSRSPPGSAPAALGICRFRAVPAFPAPIPLQSALLFHSALGEQLSCMSLTPTPHGVSVLQVGGGGPPIGYCLPRTALGDVPCLQRVQLEEYTPRVLCASARTTCAADDRPHCHGPCPIASSAPSPAHHASAGRFDLG
ncbi:hypothetical protein B0H21DRAFT_35809 [Amylocystis lapponica]|nr:hypothetical protein B0H21DRAFT_35809 [Amylocystis lapponica]